MKPTRQECSTAYRDQNPGTWPPTTATRATTSRQQLLELSHALPKILDSQLGSQPHAPPRRPCRPPIHLAWESGNHTRSHVPKCVTWVSVSSPRVETRRHTPSTRRRTDADVIRWHHHSMLTCHARLRPRQRHIIGWHQGSVARSMTQLGNLEPTRTMYPLTLSLDQLTLTFCVDLWPKVKIFEMAYLAQFFCIDSNFRLCFFIWNSEIGQLAHSSLWFLQRHSSRHLQVIFSCLPKLSLTCISSLGFSHLYILMLWLIVT